MAGSSAVSLDDRREALAAAVRDFLHAAGFDLADADLATTPQRVARLWTELFLSGYDADPAGLLGDGMPADGVTDLVVVRDIPCHGMCPHHLMPWTGRATVAYLPANKIVGFGRLAELVHCFTRRLTLQERACGDVVEALITHLDARGSACVITAQHNCLNVPDDKHAVRVTTASYRREFETRPDLQARVLSGD